MPEKDIKQNNNSEDTTGLFRREALEKTSSPEELNIPFRPVTYRKSYVILPVVIFSLLFFGWMYFGSIPVIVEGRGIAMNPRGLFSLDAKEAGNVNYIYVVPGQHVKKGQLLMRLSDPEREKQYLSARSKYQALKEDVANLKIQIQTELQTQKESIQKQIEATTNSIAEIESSITKLEIDLSQKEELYKQRLLGLQQLYESQQLLSQQRIALATTRGTLATYKANLTKSYRQQELVSKEHDLLNAQQQTDLLKLTLGNLKIVSSDEGIVLETLVNPGDWILAGTPLIRLEYSSLKPKSYIFYAYISPEAGKTVPLGSTVHIEISTVRAQEFGAIIGKITQISPYPVSRAAIGKTIQNQGLVDYLVNGHNTVIQVVIEPELDPNNPTGYHWTSGKAPPIQITVGTVSEIKGVATRITPLYYLISLWRVENLFSGFQSNKT